jgi:hypothetical protein
MFKFQHCWMKQVCLPPLAYVGLNLIRAGIA